MPSDNSEPREQRPRPLRSGPPHGPDIGRQEHEQDGRPAAQRRGRGGARPDYGQPGHLAGGHHGTGDDKSHKARDATRKAAHYASSAAGGAARAARRASQGKGAGQTGLYRLIELHAINAAGDAALAISLAGTLFFQVPSGEARGHVALFLGITMLPFAVVAPLIGPFLDRFRRGRRWAIGATMLIRAIGCWAMAGAVADQSAWMFPAALTCLIASKAYGVTRASAVPRLLPEGLSLVKANSRISLAGTAGAVISAPLAGLAAFIGPEWSLRYAFLVFIGGTVSVALLPARVDSSEGEGQVGLRDVAEPSRRSRRRANISPTVVTALRCNAGLRVLSGFLTLFMAFLLREHPLAGWEDRKTLLLALVIGSAGAGSTIGTFLGSLLKDRKPESTVLITLTADAVAAVFAALFWGLIPAMLLGLVAGLCQSLGKLSLDALIQREVPEHVRTSVFARSETLLQLSWVIGGFLGVFMPLIAKLGLFIVAAVLVGALVFVLRGRVLQT
ncbi:MAG: MFS transporter, partial [Streptosporangiaceae bacterium]